MKIIKYMRRQFNKKKFLVFKKHSSIGDDVHGHLYNVSVGDFSYVGDCVFFNTLNAKVLIGNHVMIADGVTFITGDHQYNVVGKYMNEIKEEEKSPDFDKDIIIEDDVWIGFGAIILKGVSIHKGAIIGAGSVVTKDVDEYSIVAGNPARFLKKRFSNDEIKTHERLLNE